jgi:hypothetical protein
VTDYEDLRTALDATLPDGSLASREQIRMAERRLDKRAVQAGQMSAPCFRELWGVEHTEVEL